MPSWLSSAVPPPRALAVANGSAPRASELVKRTGRGTLRPMVDYIPELRETIRRLHRCEASHTRTESVCERVDGRVLWEGRVEVFALLGHDEALRCYAWGGADEQGRWSVTTVLAIPPVVSASTAVLAAIAARVRAEQEADDK